MKLSYDNFAHCGFPEEFMFWVLIFAGLFVILSYAFLHGFVRETHKKFGLFPVILLIFNSEAFYGKGLLLRKVFVFSVLICTVTLITFKLGYSAGFLTCGVIV
jgi:hypothetical protein